MTTLELAKSITFKNILVATDFSDASKPALECAAKIAGLSEAQLFVLHALPPEPRLPVPLDHLPARLDRDLSEAKLNLKKTVASEPLRHIRHEEIMERGPVCDVVLDVIQKKKIDLLVLGTHGRTALKKIFLGSIAEELFRRASCPVLTVGPSAEPLRQIRRVLFATDFGHASAQALPYAMEFANQTDGELTLLHVASPLPVEYVGPGWYPGSDFTELRMASERKSMQQLQDLLPSGDGLKCKVEHLVEVNSVPAGIIEVAVRLGADLIVMGVRESGTSMPRLAAHMPWAIAYEVACHATCPVLTIRA